MLEGPRSVWSVRYVLAGRYRSCTEFVHVVGNSLIIIPAGVNGDHNDTKTFVACNSGEDI